MLHAGAVTDRFPGEKYFASLRFVEYAPRTPLPKSATLTRLAHQVPEGTVIALRAPSAAVAAPSTETQELALAWTLEAAERLQVAAVVFPTPVSVTPGARGRGRMIALAERLPRVTQRHYVWSPKGLWEEHEATKFAAEHGFIKAFDPIYEQRPAGSRAYAQLRTLGHQTNFSEAVMSDVLDRIAEAAYEVAFVSIESDRSFQQAMRLQSLHAERE